MMKPLERIVVTYDGIYDMSMFKGQNKVAFTSLKNGSSGAMNLGQWSEYMPTGKKINDKDVYVLKKKYRK